MKSQMELRLECLKLANTIATGKNIKPAEVIPTAMEYFKWVDGSDEPAATSRLSQRFRTVAR